MPSITVHFSYADHFQPGGRLFHSCSLPSTMTADEMLAEFRADWNRQGLQIDRLSWEAWAWPGGYPIFYVVKDHGVLCPHCANAELPRTLDPDDDQFFIVDSDINYEDPRLYCDHCGTQIECAYPGDLEADLCETSA